MELIESVYANEKGPHIKEYYIALGNSRQGCQGRFEGLVKVATRYDGACISPSIFFLDSKKAERVKPARVFSLKDHFLEQKLQHFIEAYRSRDMQSLRLAREQIKYRIPGAVNQASTLK